MPLSPCCASRAGRLTTISGAPVGFSCPGVILYRSIVVRVREVEIPVAQRDAGRAARAELLLDFELAVAVRVAQADDAAARLRLPASAAALQRDVDVAVRRDRDVTRGAESVGHDERAEPGGQLDAAVVRVARHLRLPVHRQYEREHRDGGESAASNSTLPQTS